MGRQSAFLCLLPPFTASFFLHISLHIPYLLFYWLALGCHQSCCYPLKCSQFFQKLILLLFLCRWTHPSPDVGDKLLIIVASYPRRLIFKFSYSFLFNHPVCSFWKHNCITFPVSWHILVFISKEVCRINCM